MRLVAALRVYDGSTAGPRDAEDVLEMRSPLALRYLATAPGQLGLVRAYVTARSSTTSSKVIVLEHRADPETSTGNPHQPCFRFPLKRDPNQPRQDI